MHEIVIVGGVRFRADDAARLKLTADAKAKTNAPAPITTTASQYTAQQEAAAALAASTTADAEQILADAREEAARIVADAAAEAAKIQEGAGNAGNVSGDAGGPGDADKPASDQPKTGSRAKPGK
ncbi:hypothetical protein [Arthrobacter sp. SDTb3-6]|uniref:hypothetical protein n=1 Tax=Arthrobacter sp. SDTb3-6 TaxID=2713571 RepID=UPI00159DAC4D|nr:hypothetical protein [Arthrobacter sp. SDTb3-6]NVM97823.1 hypothetical protein [Arthrobacter sp. SDTb3-6]